MATYYIGVDVGTAR